MIRLCQVFPGIAQQFIDLFPRRFVKIGIGFFELWTQPAFREKFCPAVHRGIILHAGAEKVIMQGAVFPAPDEG